MAEPGLREIQLSRKQLVFLFMASVVAVVVVFLLGVSVGRGSRPAAPPASAAADLTTAPVEPPVPPAPGTKASADALSYPQLTKGGDAAKPADPGASTPATSTSTPPPPTPAQPPTVTRPVEPPPAPPAPVKSVTPPPAKATPPASARTPPPAGSWYVQVDSFHSKNLADNLVTRLRTKGYDAYIVDTPKPLLRVRVGPYTQQNGANSARDQLRKDGFTSAFVSR